MHDLTLLLDREDFDAVQRAIGIRQTFRALGRRGTILPPGESSLVGALVAAICREWVETVEAIRRGSSWRLVAAKAREQIAEALEGWSEAQKQIEALTMQLGETQRQLREALDLVDALRRPKQ